MSGSMIEVAQPGLLTTVQDLGRWGYQKYGVPVCGALDLVSLRIANILVGNHESLAGLEMTAAGPSLKFDEDAVIAVTGADLGPQIDSKPAPSWESVHVPGGSTLSFGGPLDGLRGYLAVAGGIDVPMVMSSRSTDIKSGFGGLHGRALQPGDQLPIGPSSILGKWSSRTLPTSISRQPTYGQTFEIRVVLGPQEGMFTERGIAVLLTSEYTVSTDSDRTGYRLEGPVVRHLRWSGHRLRRLCPGVYPGARLRHADRTPRRQGNYRRIHEGRHGDKPGHRSACPGHARSQGPVRSGLGGRGSRHPARARGNDSRDQGGRWARPDRRNFPQIRWRGVLGTGHRETPHHCAIHQCVQDRHPHRLGHG